jgi:HPt (histidine-containing phosphotransfer) domain-containing protein
MDAVLHKPFTLRGLAATLAQFLTPSAAITAPSTETPAISGTLAVLRHRDDLFDQDVVAELEGFTAKGRISFVEKVVRLYCENAPACIAELHAATKSGGIDDIARASHALKSMSHTIGAKAVAAAAEQLEMTSRDGLVPDDAATAALDILLTNTLASLQG